MIPSGPLGRDSSPEPTRLIGTCEYEERKGEVMLCTSPGFCEFKHFRPPFTGTEFICTREAAALALAEHDENIRNEVMDKFGILHGEDAKRFHEYMNNPLRKQKNLCRRARAIADRLVMGCWYFDHNACPMPHPPEQRKEAEAGK